MSRTAWMLLLCAFVLTLASCASMTPEQAAATTAGVAATGLAAWQNIVDILGQHQLIKPEQQAALSAGVQHAGSLLDAANQIGMTLANSIASIRDQLAQASQAAAEAKAAAAGSVTPAEALTGLGVVAGAAEAARRAHKAGSSKRAS